MKNNKNFKLSVRAKKMISFLCVLILIFTTIPLIMENAKVSAEMSKGELIRSEEGYLTTQETYMFDVSGFFDYTVVLAGNNEADFDLYGRWNDWPTTDIYDERGYSLTSLEYFTISGEEILYIMVKCFSGEGWYKVWVISGHYFWDSDRINNYLSGDGESNADSIENFDNEAIGFAFLSGPDSSDFDLYIKWGSIPTTSDYDEKSDSIYSQEMCNAIGFGIFYYMSYSYEGCGDYTVLFLFFDPYEDYTYVLYDPGIESSHPYDNNEYFEWSFDEGEQYYKMRVYFEILDFEAGYDYLYIYDEYDNLQWSYTNDVDDEPQYDVITPWITGNTITILMETDGSVTRFGFIVEVIECAIRISGGSGGIYEDDKVFLLEAESICHDDQQYPDGQVINDYPSTKAIRAYPNINNDPEIHGNNLFKTQVNLLTGIYKYYFRARSDIWSKITIGVNLNGNSQPILEEDFLLSPLYRWYISEDFIITGPPDQTTTVEVWAHSYLYSEFFDSIMLVRWRDANGNQISGTLGQIIDINPYVVDSDNDGIIDKSTGDDDPYEFNENIWWLEAEHFKHPTNVKVVIEDDASNCKSIIVDGDILNKVNNPIPEEVVYGPYGPLNLNLGLIPMLSFSRDDFPMFIKGKEYQLFVRAKGPKDAYFCMEAGYSTIPFLSVSQTMTPEKNYFVDREYRWFASPKFSTFWNNEENPELWIQILSTPPQVIEGGHFQGVGCISIDKIMVLQTKDNSDPPQETDYEYGQLTDPLDPDTDLDGRSDGLERNREAYWFEAEYWIHNDNWNQNNNQLEYEEPLASNSKAMKRIGDSNPLIDPNMILDLNNLISFINQVDVNYKLYLRAKTKSETSITDKIDIKFVYDSTMKTTSFVLTSDYRWYMSPDFSPSSPSPIVTILIESICPDVVLDELMFIKCSAIIDGQLSDPLNPDMDWDKIMDGDEVSNDVYWVEGETGQMAYMTNTGTNSNGPDSSNSFGAYIEENVNFDRQIDEGSYQLYFRAKYGSGDPHLGVEVICNSMPILITQFYLVNYQQWYSTEEFEITGKQITITISFNVFIDEGQQPPIYSVAYLDKFVLVKRATLSLEPSERPSGVNPTDPLDPDTDLDGRIDGHEYNLNLKWFEIEHYSDLPLYEDTIGESKNNIYIKTNTNKNIMNLDITLPGGVYNYLVRAKKDDDDSKKIELHSKISYEDITETQSQALISDYKWYNCITFYLPLQSAVTISLTSSVPLGWVYIDKILLIRTIDEKNYPTGLKLGELLGPRNDHIYLAKPGKISDALDDDTDGDSFIDSNEINGVEDIFLNRYILDPLNSDSDGDNLLDNIEVTSLSNPTLADTDGDHIPDGWIDGWGYSTETYIYEFGLKNDEKDLGNADYRFTYLEGEDIDRNGIVKKVNGYFSETSPLLEDTDSDELDDNFEYVYETDPFDRDFDDDGLKDGEESWPPYGTSMATDGDYDGDGLTDGLEMGITTFVPGLNIDGNAGNDVKGTDTISNNYQTDTDPTSTTNPKEWDTDHDGIPDGWIDFDEGGTGDYDVGEFEDKDCDGKRDGNDPTDSSSDWNSGAGPGETDPGDRDTDGDGFSDGVELYAALPSSTDPLNPYNNPTDSDSDGLSDAYEDENGDGYCEGDWGEDSIKPGDPGNDPSDPTEDDHQWQHDTESRSTESDFSNDDTDNDEAKDGDELDAGTDKTEPDSDSDGIMDGREGNFYDFTGKFKSYWAETEENGETKWNIDSDWDGTWEKNIETDGWYNTGINALDKDSDDDGLTDTEEARVLFRTNVKNGDYKYYTLYGENYFIQVDIDNTDEVDYDLETYIRINTVVNPSDPDRINDLIITITPEGYDVKQKGEDTHRLYIDYGDGSNAPLYLYTESDVYDIYGNKLLIDKDWIFKQTWDWFTNPTCDDTDGDCITDYREIHGKPPGIDCKGHAKTHPLKADTDGDGIIDSKEIFFYQTDPLDPNGDADGDGLIDATELMNNFNLELDPKDPDTDDDDLWDGWEYKYLELIYNTYKDEEGYNSNHLTFLNPTKPDSNLNGITDEKETGDFAGFINGEEKIIDDYLPNIYEFSKACRDYNPIESWDTEFTKLTLGDYTEHGYLHPVNLDYDADGDKDGLDFDGDGFYDGTEVIFFKYSKPLLYDPNNFYVISDPKDSISIPNDLDGDAHDFDESGNPIDNDGDGKANENGYGDFTYPFNTEGLDRMDKDDDNDGWTNLQELGLEPINENNEAYKFNCKPGGYTGTDADRLTKIDYDRFIQTKLTDSLGGGIYSHFYDLNSISKFDNGEAFTNRPLGDHESNTILYHYADVDGDEKDELIRTNLYPSDTTKAFSFIYEFSDNQWAHKGFANSISADFKQKSTKQLYHFGNVIQDIGNPTDELIITTISTSGSTSISSKCYGYSDTHNAWCSCGTIDDDTLEWFEEGNDKLYDFADLDGDSFDELILTVIDNSDDSLKSYVHKNNEDNDWVEEYIVEGDTSRDWFEQSDSRLYRFGDINGDGKDELILIEITHTTSDIGYTDFKYFYINNNKWTLLESYQDSLFREYKSDTYLYHFADPYGINLYFNSVYSIYKNIPTNFWVQILSDNTPKEGDNGYTWIWDFDITQDTDLGSDGKDNDKDGLVDSADTDYDNPNGYSWSGNNDPNDDGDGSGQFPVYTFSQEGTYIGKLTLINDYEVVSKTFEIHVEREVDTHWGKADTDDDKILDTAEYYGWDIDTPRSDNPPGLNNIPNYVYNTLGTRALILNNDYHYITNPTYFYQSYYNGWDTDNDGVADNEEIESDTVPFIYVDNTLDTDSDGLEDGDEWTIDEHPYGGPARNLDGVVQSYWTDPLNIDTDFDGVQDGWEVILNKNPQNEQDVYSFKLNVAFDYNIGTDLTGFIIGMGYASNYLFDVTDGHMVVSDIYIYNNINQNSYIWKYVDIRVYDGSPFTPCANTGGIVKDKDDYPTRESGSGRENYGHIYIPKKHRTAAGQIQDRTWTSDIVGYKIIIHELGHYGLFLSDEHSDAEYDRYPNYPGTTSSIGPNGFMNDEFKYSEMTTPEDYTMFFEILELYNSDPMSSDYSDTHQHSQQHKDIGYTGNMIDNPNAGESCWETIFKKYNHYNGEYIKWIEFDLNPNVDPEETFYTDYTANDGPDQVIYTVGDLLKNYKHFYTS